MQKSKITVGELSATIHMPEQPWEALAYYQLHRALSDLANSKAVLKAEEMAGGSPYDRRAQLHAALLGGCYAWILGDRPTGEDLAGWGLERYSYYIEAGWPHWVMDKVASKVCNACIVHLFRDTEQDEFAEALKCLNFTVGTPAIGIESKPTPASDGTGGPTP